DPFVALSKIFRGEISAGISFLEEAILRRDGEGWSACADWCRGILAEVYLQMIARSERLPILALLKTLPLLLKIAIIGPSRVLALTGHMLQNTQFDSSGQFIGRTQMIVGLLHKTKRRRALAIEHLTDSKGILSQFGQTPILTRVETALADLAH